MSEMFEMGLSYPKGLKCFNWAKLSQNALNFANVLNFPKIPPPGVFVPLWALALVVLNIGSCLFSDGRMPKLKSV